jgi:RNase P/RNase MRP subunit p29
MAHVYISTIGATLIALFSMAAVAETTPPGTSGIEGTIVVSPTRPGPIRKDEERSVAPVRNAQFAIKTGDATVKTFTTDGEGRFQVALPPGHYVIVKEGALPRIGRWRFEADVVAGQVTKVKWTADSGMR